MHGLMYLCDVVHLMCVGMDMDIGVALGGGGGERLATVAWVIAMQVISVFSRQGYRKQFCSGGATCKFSDFFSKATHPPKVDLYQKSL